MAKRRKEEGKKGGREGREGGREGREGGNNGFGSFTLSLSSKLTNLRTTISPDPWYII